MHELGIKPHIFMYTPALLRISWSISQEFSLFYWCYHKENSHMIHPFPRFIHFSCRDDYRVIWYLCFCTVWDLKTRTNDDEVMLISYLWVACLLNLIILRYFPDRTLTKQVCMSMDYKTKSVHILIKTDKPMRDRKLMKTHVCIKKYNILFPATKWNM